MVHVGWWLSLLWQGRIRRAGVVCREVLIFILHTLSYERFRGSGQGVSSFNHRNTALLRQGVRNLSITVTAHGKLRGATVSRNWCC